jgi:hypothetical protein
MSLLQARYSVYERMLYHPTKCVAGAVLGAAIQFMGWRKLPPNLRYVGDAVFLFQVSEAARLVRDLLSNVQRERSFNAELAEELRKRILALPVNGISAAALQLIQDRLATAGDIAAELNVRTQLHGRSDETELGVAVHELIKHEKADELLENILHNLEAKRGDRRSTPTFALQWLRKKVPTTQTVINELKAGLRLLDRLHARRYLKITYRLLPNVVLRDVHLKAKDVAELFKQPLPRKMAEREIERRAGLPPGTLVIHCPPVKGPTKIARILIASTDAYDRAKERQVEMLSEIGDIDRDVFEMHQKAVEALGEMYRSTWRFAVSVAPPFDADWQKINGVIGKVLREMLTDVDGPPLANDRYTVMEMEALELAIQQLDAREQAAEISGDGAGKRKSGKAKRAFETQISEADLVQLMRPYIAITGLARLPDPKLKAVLTRVRNLHPLGLDTFKAALPEPELLGSAGEHNVKDDGYDRLVKAIRDAVTKAEEAEAAAEA